MYAVYPEHDVIVYETRQGVVSPKNGGKATQYLLKIEAEPSLGTRWFDISCPGREIY